MYPLEVGTLQLSRIVRIALRKHHAVLVITPRVLVRPRIYELSKYATADDLRYTVTTPQMFMKNPDAWHADLIIVDAVGTHSGKFDAYLKTCQLPVWRRLQAEYVEAAWKPLSPDVINEIKAFQAELESLQQFVGLS